MSEQFWHRTSRASVPHPAPHIHERSTPLVRWLDRILRASLALGIFLAPLLFSGLTFEPLEINKQTLLLVVACVGLAARLLRACAEKRLSFYRHWPHLFVFIFTVGYLVSSCLSNDRYLSFVGNYGQEAWAFSTIAACVIFYFLLANEVRTTKQVYNYLFLFLASSGIAGLFGFFQLFGIFLLPFRETHVLGFTTIGTADALATFMVVPLIIASALSFHGCRDRVCVLGLPSLSGRLARLFVWVVAAIALAVLIAVDFWVAWAALLIGTAWIVMPGFVRSRRLGKPATLVLPVILLVVSSVLLLFKSPVTAKIPFEVAPSLSASWDIARQSLQHAPVFGTGPATWAYNYSQYRNPGVNLSPFWNLRFDHGISSLLTLLPTIGILGSLLWLLVIGSVIFYSITHLWREKSDDLWYAYATVFAAWITLVFIACFYQFSVSHQLAFWMFTALLSGLTAKETLLFEGKHASKSPALLWVVTVVGLCASLSILWLSAQRWYADRLFAKAAVIAQSNRPITEAFPFLDGAVQVNRLDDGYLRNAAQAHLINAVNQIQTQVDSSRVSQVQAELAQALDWSRQAVALAPGNVDNWANVANVYATIIPFTRGADEQAIHYYQEAIIREPQNPSLLDAFGQVYLARADADQPLTDSGDAKAKATAAKDMADALRLAFDRFSQAAKAKPDYLPAHYHLGVTYQRQGKVPEAIQEMTQVLGAQPNDVGVAFELAILFYQHNEGDKALALLDQIVKADPQNVNARWYLALIEEEAHQFDQARFNLQVLAQQLPDNIAIKQRLDALSKAQKSGPLPEPLPENVTDQSKSDIVKSR